MDPSQSAALDRRETPMLIGSDKVRPSSAGPKRGMGRARPAASRSSVIIVCRLIGKRLSVETS
jgi:hypothetical protein